MKNLILIVLFISSLAALAARPKIDVKTELSINGKIVPRERIRMTVKAHPTDERMDEIVVNMDLEFKSGERVIRSTPQIYAKSGAEATLTLDESTKDEKIVLKVMARPESQSR